VLFNYVCTTFSVFYNPKSVADFHDLPMPMKIAQRTNGATKPNPNPSPYRINKRLTLNPNNNSHKKLKPQ